MRKFISLLLIVGAASIWAAIPEAWFAAKAAIGEATREVIYATSTRRNRVIGELPADLLAAFVEPPADGRVWVGEAYFIDHCLNHHPDVEDAIYRRLQEFLDSPEEVIQDRREARDGLILTKTIAGQGYALVLRHYGGTRGQIVYKTLYPIKPNRYPHLPRFKRAAQETR